MVRVFFAQCTRYTKSHLHYHRRYERMVLLEEVIQTTWDKHTSIVCKTKPHQENIYVQLQTTNLCISSIPKHTLEIFNQPYFGCVKPFIIPKYLNHFPSCRTKDQNRNNKIKTFRHKHRIYANIHGSPESWVTSTKTCHILWR